MYSKCRIPKTAELVVFWVLKTPPKIKFKSYHENLEKTHLLQFSDSVSQK